MIPLKVVLNTVRRLASTFSNLEQFVSLLDGHRDSLIHPGNVLLNFDISVWECKFPLFVENMSSKLTRNHPHYPVTN